MFIFVKPETSVDKRFRLELGRTGIDQANLSSLSTRQALLAGEQAAFDSANQLRETINEGVTEVKTDGDAPKLSSRQQEILSYIIQGYQNKAIADQLGIEIVTVKMHIGMLFKKLGVTNRTRAAVRGIGLIHDREEARSDKLCREV